MRLRGPTNRVYKEKASVHLMSAQSLFFAIKDAITTYRILSQVQGTLIKEVIHALYPTNRAISSHFQ
jgi:hypothetical protein